MVKEIPILILLLSPRGRHESELLVRGVCTTWAMAGSPSAVLRPPFLGRGQGRSSTKAALRCGLGAGEGSGCCSRPQHPPEGLAAYEGVVPSDLLAPPAGRRGDTRVAARA